MKLAVLAESVNDNYSLLSIAPCLFCQGSDTWVHTQKTRWVFWG